jgi:glucose/arabinose dehydrogenase
MKLLTLLVLTLLVPLAAPAQEAPVALTAKLITDQLERPIFATAPAGDPRLFVVEQTGRIRILADGVLADAPFLDLSASISIGGERGLLGLAFHPDYAENGRFFVNYTDVRGDTQVAAYRVSGDPNVADPASAELILNVGQPYANHNGGWIGFGPDGLLYIAMGDGGSGNDPHDYGQRRDRLLGKILRLDVDSAAPYAIPPGNPFAQGGGAPEIFVTGVRNPWRNAFDGDLLYVADVGQGIWEEVTVLSPADAGANLGWKIMEGPACRDGSVCDQAGLKLPTHAYKHDGNGCSITGGHVYRGAAIPEIVGLYFFADYCSGKVWSFRYAAGEARDLTDWTGVLHRMGPVSSFGLDAKGELYLTTVEGSLFQIVRAD